MGPCILFAFFLYGYLLISNAQTMVTIRKYATASLIAASILTIFYIDSHFGIHFVIPGITRHNISDLQAKFTVDLHISAAVQAFRGLVCWLWIIGLLGIASRLLNCNRPFLSRLNEAVLPFYMIHHPIILVIGYFIISWNNGIFAKYAVIVGISFVVIMVICEFLIRRFKVLRFLFGLKIVRSLPRVSIQK